MAEPGARAAEADEATQAATTEREAQEQISALIHEGLTAATDEEATERFLAARQAWRGYLEQMPRYMAEAAASEVLTDSEQARWEAVVDAVGFTYVNESLRDRSYLDREFPPAVELDDTTELVVWTNDKRRTMDEIRAAMVEEGITPASPQHGPAFAPEQEDGTTVWVPQYSESADSDGDRSVVYLGRHGADRGFYRHWHHPGNRWYEGYQFLGVRTKPSDA